MKSRAKIELLRFDVPVRVSTPRRNRRENPHIGLEIYGSGVKVWDSVDYTVCGEIWSFTQPSNWAIFGRDRLTEIPYVDQVGRHLADERNINRGNPIGDFLTPAVEALDQALRERDGSRVYFAGAGSRIKIGWSRNVAARIAQLQTGNAEAVRLLATTPGARALERQLHDQFAEARVAGEWFEATPALVAYVAALSGSGRTPEAACA